MSDTEINGNVSQGLGVTSSTMEDSSDYTDADESMSAPTEILAEFLSAVMSKDYDRALKYCQLILCYEPENSTAKEFYPLIVHKLQIIEADEDGDSLSDSSESYNLTSSSSSDNSLSYDNKGRNRYDSGATTASYSSLEEDEETDQNNGVIQDFGVLRRALTNGNVADDVSTKKNSSGKEESPKIKQITTGEKEVKSREKKTNSGRNANLPIQPKAMEAAMGKLNELKLDRTRTYTMIKNDKNPVKINSSSAAKSLKSSLKNSRNPPKKTSLNSSEKKSKTKIPKALPKIN